MNYPCLYLDYIRFLSLILSEPSKHIVNIDKTDGIAAQSRLCEFILADLEAALEKLWRVTSKVCRCTYHY